MNFCKAVQNYFHKPLNKIWARHDFFTWFQSAGETVHEFVTELWVLVRDCEFGALEKELIATQLAVGCFNTDAKKQLLQKADIELEAYVALVHAVETSESNLSALQVSSSVHKLSMGANSKRTGSKQGTQKYTQNSGNASSGKQRGGNQATSGSRNKPVLSHATPQCTGCGKMGHMWKSEQCPTVIANCRYCGTIGHFFAQCRKRI